MNLYGASGHCKVIIDALRSNVEDVVIDAVFDDNPKTIFFNGIPVTKATSDSFLIKLNLIVSIGNNQDRKKIVSKIVATYHSVVHANAIVSGSAQINVGTVVFAGAVVNADAIIGSHCIINSGAIVEHDCVVDDFAHISPNAALGGAVTVGEGTHIGIGAVVIQGVKIGKWAVIGAGAVVIKDIPDYAVAVGNPATIIKYAKH